MLLIVVFTPIERRVSESFTGLRFGRIGEVLADTCCCVLAPPAIILIRGCTPYGGDLPAIYYRLPSSIVLSTSNPTSAPAIFTAMAVIPDVDGLKVEVVTNGEPLEEYVDNEEERVPETVTKYIEAKSGEEFGVRWTIAHPYPEYGVLFDVYLDGKFIRGAFARQHIFVGPSISHVISGRCCIVKDEWYMQKFCFTELTVGTGLLVCCFDSKKLILCYR